jgi:hypothetical protein
MKTNQHPQLPRDRRLTSQAIGIEASEGFTPPTMALDAVVAEQGGPRWKCWHFTHGTMKWKP